jgi:hypothetical protein
MNNITNKDIEHKYTYFMDNVTIHHCKEFKNIYYKERFNTSNFMFK